MKSRTVISNVALVDELSAWSVGLGILTMALAPLAIPIIALTAVAALILLAPVLAVGLLAGLLALPVLLLRATARRARRFPFRRTTRGSGGVASGKPDVHADRLARA